MNILYINLFKKKNNRNELVHTDVTENKLSAAILWSNHVRCRTPIVTAIRRYLFIEMCTMTYCLVYCVIIYIYFMLCCFWCGKINGDFFVDSSSISLFLYSSPIKTHLNPDLWHRLTVPPLNIVLVHTITYVSPITVISCLANHYLHTEGKTGSGDKSASYFSSAPLMLKPEDLHQLFKCSRPKTAQSLILCLTSDYFPRKHH